MTLEYSGRLLCLCLAAFFLVHLAVGLMVSLFTARAVKMAERTTPRVAAGWLLTLRLLPPAVAFFVVLTLCIPSYLWLEPDMAGEEAGFVCLASAFLALAVWCISSVRAARSAARSVRYIDRCASESRRTRLEGEISPVWVMAGTSGSLMLAGILRPRLFVSRKVMSVLSPEQLAAALRHERCHLVSRDNLKRLLMTLSPGILPFFRGFDALEGHWARLTEWAADDHAVDGDSGRSLALAAALVQVARLRPAPQPPSLVTSLLNGGRDLEARVERLLRGAPERHESGLRFPWMAAGTALVLSGLMVGVMVRPSTFQSVHRLLEDLIH